MKLTDENESGFAPIARKRKGFIMENTIKLEIEEGTYVEMMAYLERYRSLYFHIPSEHERVVNTISRITEAYAKRNDKM